MQLHLGVVHQKRAHRQHTQCVEIARGAQQRHDFIRRARKRNPFRAAERVNCFGRKGLGQSPEATLPLRQTLGGEMPIKIDSAGGKGEANPEQIVR